MGPANSAEISRLLLAFRSGDHSALARLAPLVSSTAGHWDRIGELFDEAVGLHADERVALLDRECAGNPALRAEVDSLLRAAGESVDFIGGSIARVASDLEASRRDAAATGAKPGRGCRHATHARSAR